MNENVQDPPQSPSSLWLQGRGHLPCLGALLVSLESSHIHPLGSCGICHLLVQWLVSVPVFPSRRKLPEGNVVCGEEHVFGAVVQIPTLLVTAVGLGASYLTVLNLSFLIRH